jgi:uncharacterized membrane protein YeaQ/YmgE (transglycosylase-associated protein family)
MTDFARPAGLQGNLGGALALLCGGRGAGPLAGAIHMNFILMLIIGGILGWLASIIMRRDAQQGIILNVVVGIVGALLAGLLITPLIGGAPITSGAFDIRSIIASLIGAIVLLGIVNMFTRGRVR